MEFDVVFLPRVLDGEVPYRSGRTAADPQEERRLFYVGLTRARHWLAITWPTDGKAGASPFVAEATGRVPEAVKPAAKKQAVPSGDPLFERLRALFLCSRGVIPKRSRNRAVKCDGLANASE